ncbi:alpha/beta hydrolase [Microbulbifer sp. YPW1]|uniref:alpha/beta hydrolase n=1 Tax=Microbulbifer sp. YPW1 TaxID=2745199 RepID=UPI00159A54CE|nr:alpha/beta hydrolase-fold protein [Microbulbifer sp. YPW1]QKX16332.1 alpha/beta hydrolase [Microbulbifer sp. YPW1]
MKKLTCWVSAICFGLLNGSAGAEDSSILFEVTAPAGYSVKDTVHLVGDFNNWALEGDDAVTLEYVDGTLRAEVVVSEEDLFFTFVKNKDWGLTPTSEAGKSLCTYHLRADASDVAQAEIPAWRGDVPTQKAPSTKRGNLRTLRNFPMPELGRSADIVVYLPPSYETASSIDYPVLYMLDGQNLFDSASAYSDEWQVDETIERLVAAGELPELIVVAIPNSGNRWIEYNPWDFRDRDGSSKEGLGGLTMEFIRARLKPYIDNHFHTRSGRENTGVAGSSLGGLMAIYAALEHSDTFGFVAAFSPALDIKNVRGKNVLFEAIDNSADAVGSRIYFDIGKVEYGDFQRIEALERALLENGAESDRLMLVKDKLGRHCELDWSRRLPVALKWWLQE